MILSSYPDMIQIYKLTFYFILFIYLVYIHTRKTFASKWKSSNNRSKQSGTNKNPYLINSVMFLNIAFGLTGWTSSWRS